MAYIRTIRRWIGDDINIFRCAQCGTFVTRPAKAVIRDARKNSN
jgi:Zn ribbon nucleic-acid-binding protein